MAMGLYDDKKPYIPEHLYEMPRYYREQGREQRHVDGLRGRQCPQCGSSSLAFFDDYLRDMFVIECRRCFYRLAMEKDAFVNHPNGLDFMMDTWAHRVMEMRKAVLFQEEEECPHCFSQVQFKIDGDMCYLLCKECGERFVTKLERYNKIGIGGMLREWRGHVES